MRRYLQYIIICVILGGIASLFNTVAAQQWKQVGDVVQVGDLIKFPNGDKGVVCYVDPYMPTRGWAMATTDAGSYKLYNNVSMSECALPQHRTDIVRYDLDTTMSNSYKNEGWENTRKLRESGKSDAANAVDFDNGWYIPNSLQLWTMFMVSAQYYKQNTFTQIKTGNGDWYWTCLNVDDGRAWAMQALYGGMPRYECKSTGDKVKPIQNALLVRAVRDFGYESAEGYWAEKFNQDGTKVKIWKVGPKVTTPYHAVIVYNNDTLTYTDSVKVNPTYDKDTIYEVVCATNLANNSNKFTSVLDPAHFSNITIKTNPNTISSSHHVPGNPAYDATVGYIIRTKKGYVPTVKGCDSILTLILKVVPSCDFNANIQLCEEDLPYTLRVSDVFNKSDYSDDFIIDGERLVKITGTGTVTVTAVAKDQSQNSYDGYISVTVYPNSHDVYQMSACTYEDSISWMVSDQYDTVIHFNGLARFDSFTGTDTTYTICSPIYKNNPYECDSRDTLYLTLYKRPLIQSIGDFTDVCPNQVDTFWVKVKADGKTKAPYTYEWSSLDDGLQVLGATRYHQEMDTCAARVQVPPGCGSSYELYVEAIDDNGCRSARDTVHVNTVTQEHVSLVISPRADTTLQPIDCVCDTVRDATSIADLERWFSFSGSCGNPMFGGVESRRWEYNDMSSCWNQLTIKYTVYDACGITGQPHSLVVVQPVVPAPPRTVNDTLTITSYIQCRDDTIPAVNSMAGLRDLGFVYDNNYHNCHPPIDFVGVYSNYVEGLGCDLHRVTQYVVKNVCPVYDTITFIQQVKDETPPTVHTFTVNGIPAGGCAYYMPNVADTIEHLCYDRCNPEGVVSLVRTYLPDGTPVSANSTPFLQADTLQHIKIVAEVKDECGNPAEDIFTLIIPGKSLEISASPDTTVCLNSQIQLRAESSTYSNLAPSYEWSGLHNAPIAQGEDVHSNSVMTGILTQQGVYSYEVAVSMNGCTPQKDTINVTIAPEMVIHYTPSVVSVCQHHPITKWYVHDSITGGSGTFSYQWFVGSTQLWPDVPGQSTTLDGYRAGSGDAHGAWNYYVAVTDACTTKTANVATVTVNPEYNVMDTMQVCEHDLPFYWQGVEFRKSGVATRRLQTSSGCDSVVTMVVIVGLDIQKYISASICEGDAYVFQDNSGETIKLTESGIYQNKTKGSKCDSITTLTLTVYPSQNQSLTEQACGSYTWNHGTDGLPVTYTAEGTHTYTFEHTDGNGCPQVDTLHLTIYNYPTLSADVTDQVSTCVGTTVPLQVTHQQDSVGQLSYRWERSANGTNGWTTIENATSATYNAPINETGHIYYRVTIEDDGRYTDCNSLMLGTEVVVMPALTITEFGRSTNMICPGATRNLSVTATGGSGSYTYTWQRSTNENGPWENIQGAPNASTYTAVADAESHTIYYRVIVGDICGTATSDIVYITPYPALAATPITGGTNGTCIGTNIELAVNVTGGSGSYRYRWERSASGTEGSWMNLNTDLERYQPSTASAGTNYYRVIIADASCNNSITTDTTRVTVWPTPSVTITGGVAGVCIGSTPPPTLQATLYNISAENNVTYQWQKSTSLTGVWTDVGEDSRYKAPTATAGTTYYRLVIKDHGYDGACNTAISNTQQVTVWSNDLIVPDIPNVTECIGANQSVSAVPTVGSGDYTYDWEEMNSENQWVSAYHSSQTVGVYYPLSTESGTKHYRVTVHDVGNVCNTNGVTKTFDVTVLQELVVEDLANRTVAQGDEGATTPITATVTSGEGEGHYHYQWQRSNDNGSTYTDILGAIDDATYNAPIDEIGTFYYKVIVSEDMGCNRAEATMTLEVTDLVPLTASITSDDATLCAEAQYTITSTANGGTGSYTYQWQRSDDHEAWSDVADSTRASFVATATPAGNTTYYRVVVTSGTEIVPTNYVFVAAYEAITATASADAPNYCIDATATLTASVNSTNHNGVHYQWLNSDDSEIAGATNATYTGSTSEAGPHTYKVRVTDDCNSAPVVISVSYNVYEAITATASADAQNYCIGATATLTANVTSTNHHGVHYQWLNADGSPIEDSTNVTFTGSTATAGEHIYKVQVTDDCNSAPVVITVSYNVYEAIAATASAN